MNSEKTFVFPLFNCAKRIEENLKNLFIVFRYSINQAKEMFLSNLEQESDKNKVYDAQKDPKNNNLLYPDNNSAQALLDGSHSSMKVQSGNESSGSKSGAVKSSNSLL